MRSVFSTAAAAACLSIVPQVFAAPTSTIELERRQLTPTSQQSLPSPLTDPFYVAPHNISAYQPGEIVRSRDVMHLPLLGAPLDKTTQIYYRTTDAQGEASGTVATVWSPLVPANPPKILSYQYADDSLSINCAPSWAWVNQSSQNNYAAQNEGPVVLNFALSNGWHVVAADHEGSNAAFIAGNVEGRAVLDAIRGTHGIRKLDKTKSRVALYGYSGGGHASAWAATLAGGYASDLNVIGIAAGGIPVDPMATVEHDNEKTDAPLVAGGIFGLGQAYPKLNATLEREFTETGAAISSEFRNPAQCLVKGPLQTKYANYDFFSIFKSGAAILNETDVQEVLMQESLLNTHRASPAPVFKFPAHLYHVDTDETVPYPATVDYIKQQCGGGANIRFITIHNTTHVGGFIQGLPGALTFLGQAMDGIAPVTVCGQDLMLLPPL